MIKCNDENIAGKLQNCVRSTGNSGSTSLPPVGDSFNYIETTSDIHGGYVFCSCERTDIIQISNITFYYNRFSILTNDSLKSMGTVRIQRLLQDITWSTQYTIAKNTQFTDNSSDWTLLILNFTIENYGIKLIYDQIDTAHSDFCFSKITKKHSVY